MAPLVTLALLIGLPAVIIFLLRANGAVVFLALCGGSVLAQFVSSDSTNILNSFRPASGTLNLSVVQLSLLFAPAFFAALLLRKSLSGTKAMVNLIPAVATGAVGALLAVPLLPGGVHHNITSNSLWSSIDQYQSLIVAAAILVSLVGLRLNRTKRPHKGKHKK